MWQFLALTLGYPIVATLGEAAIKKYVTGEYDLARLEQDLMKAQAAAESRAKGLMAADIEGRMMTDRAFAGTQEELAWEGLKSGNPEAVLSRERAMSGQAAKQAGDLRSMVAKMAQQIGLSPEQVAQTPTAREFSPGRAMMGLV